MLNNLVQKYDQLGKESSGDQALSDDYSDKDASGLSREGSQSDMIDQLIENQKDNSGDKTNEKHAEKGQDKKRDKSKDKKRDKSKDKKKFYG